MNVIFNDWVHLKFKNISSFEKQFYQTQYELSKNTISDQSPPNLKSLVHIKIPVQINHHLHKPNLKSLVHIKIHHLHKHKSPLIIISATGVPYLVSNASTTFKKV